VAVKFFPHLEPLAVKFHAVPAEVVMAGLAGAGVVAVAVAVFVLVVLGTQVVVGLGVTVYGASKASQDTRSKSAGKLIAIGSFKGSPWLIVALVGGLMVYYSLTHLHQ